MDERDPPAVVEFRDDLVAEDDARMGRVELLDVRPAEPAGDDANELARPIRLGDVGDRRLSLRPDDDGAHPRIVGSSLRLEGRKEPSMALKLHRCPHTWIKLSGHPCWKVQKALDDMGVEYEIVPGAVAVTEEAHGRDRGDRPERAPGDRARRWDVVPRAILRRWPAQYVTGASVPPPDRRYTFPLAGL